MKKKYLIEKDYIFPDIFPVEPHKKFKYTCGYGDEKFDIISALDYKQFVNSLRWIRKIKRNSIFFKKLIVHDFMELEYFDFENNVLSFENLLKNYAK